MCMGIDDINNNVRISISNYLRTEQNIYIGTNLKKNVNCLYLKYFNTS